MLITGSIPNLFGGVSQQTPAMRLPSQCEDIENFYPSLVHGTIKRPPTHFVRDIPAAYAHCKMHRIRRDASQVYILLLGRGILRVMDRSGAWQNVTMSADAAYLNTDNLRACTIADYTFIVNQDKAVRASATTTPVQRKNALVFVKQASYQTDYSVRVTIDGVGTWSTKETTPHNVGTTEEPPAKISTEDIATALRNGLSNTALRNHVDIVSKGSTVFLRPRTAAVDMLCEVSDSRGNTHITAIMQTVQKFADLPSIAPEGYVVKVVGDNSAADDFYVKFLPERSMSFGESTDPGADYDAVLSNALQSGVWVETLKPGTSIGFDGASMPHALVHENGKFVFKQLSWSRRTVGDGESAPDPEFVGRAIAEVFLYRNRLCFLSDDTASMSAAGDFFNFYPDTVMTYVSSSPISIASGYSEVTQLRYARSFQENVLIFAESAQFTLSGSDVLSGETAELRVATTFDIDVRVPPVSNGKTMFYCVGGTGGVTGVREYYTETDLGTKNAANITAHVPTYLKNAVKLQCATLEDVLVVQSAEPGTLYVYKYYWSGNEKLQSAWVKFTLPGTVRDILFVDAVLYVTLTRDGETVLLSMDFTVPPYDARATVYLDLTTTIQGGTYDDAANTTTWDAPYAPPDTGERRAVIIEPQSLRTLSVVSVDGKRITARGNHTGAYTLGLSFPASYVFSEQFLRQDNGEGKIATHQGRLQFRRWSISYGPSSHFKVQVDHAEGGSYEYTFNAQKLGARDAVLGRQNTGKGVFRFPVKSQASRARVALRNDTHMPCSILSAEWEAFYTTRDRRI